MFSDMDRSGRRTLLFFILLTINTISGIVGGLGIAYAGNLNTDNHQTLGLIFCFIAALILLTSGFVVILHRERERSAEEQFPV
jgi:uncharacterized membrane protein (UPF0136 family)